MKSQFAFLFRNKASLKNSAQRFLDLVDPIAWGKIPGNTSSSRIEKELTEAFCVYECVTNLIGGDASLREALVCDVCSGKGFLSLLLHERGGKVLAIDKGFSKMASTHMDTLNDFGVSPLQIDILAPGGDLFALQLQHFLLADGALFPGMFDNFTDSSRKRREELDRAVKDLEAATLLLLKEKSRKQRAVIVSIHPCGALAERVLSVFTTSLQLRSGVESFCFVLFFFFAFASFFICFKDVCVVVPCCAGPGPSMGYQKMCEQLVAPFARRSDLVVDLKFDANMASDKNGIISILVA
jgi:hypothetical protein